VERNVERKLASVLFVDLVGSTALVSMSDPEVVRRRVNRFFERVQHCVETHGGIVEKFAGDAVMAAFGIPLAHEDDAERATRAGLAILDAVHELELEARAGVESGEVVADDGDSTFATGEAVNLAARLQQAAESGQLYVGPAAHRLTAGRVEFEDVGPVEVKGRDEPIWAWRAVRALDGQPGPRRLDAPLVGREAELELLENTFSRAVRDRRAHVFTIFGEPGIGKSRLASEFLEGLEGATVLAGRCLPYGEGITYWPLAEMVKSAAGISDDEPVKDAVVKLRECCEDEAVADLLGLASGVLEAVESDHSQQEIAWAARAFAERLAQELPLVLVFEDIHWGEEPLLELIEHLAEWVRTTPLLILCLSRPELLELHSHWGGGRTRFTAIELEPLVPEESRALVAALLEEALPHGLEQALLDKTEGNPLFVEESIRMLAESGTEALSEFADRIPDTVQALIAARIDRLPLEEKLLLQRASVIGRVFWAGAVGALSPELENAEAVLDQLLWRDLITPEARSTITGETAYRFKHVLIREVAYAGLSKSGRADHHARFAAWLEERSVGELFEIRAFHLDQAVGLLAELDGSAPQELTREAAAALEEAGRRALAREANRSARKLFLRSQELEPTLERRYQAAKAAWHLSDLPAVSVEMDEVCRAAEAAGDPRIQGSALTALAEVAILRDADLPRAQQLAERALAVLGEEQAAARYRALSVRGTIAWYHGRLDHYERLACEARELAQHIGRKDLESEATADLASAFLSRLELDEAQPLVDQAIALAEEDGGVVSRGLAYRFSGILHLERRELDEAEAALEEARTLLSEAGAAWAIARTLNFAAWTAWWKGDTSRAERLFRESIRILKPMEDRATLCESQRGLAQLLAEQGRLRDAERFALQARETVGPQDVTSLATTTMALGVVLAAQGRDEEAEGLLREALKPLAATDHHRVELEVLGTLAQFLRDRGRDEDAAALDPRLAELRPSSTARIA
jgi:predicted ATPase/class 3 adenylate cyclase